MKTQTKRKANWIQKAIQKPGSFSEDALQHGKTTEAYAQKERDASGKLGRRARLAETLMAMQKKKARTS